MKHRIPSAMQSSGIIRFDLLAIAARKPRMPYPVNNAPTTSENKT